MYISIKQKEVRPKVVARVFQQGSGGQDSRKKEITTESKLSTSLDNSAGEGWFSMESIKLGRLFPGDTSKEQKFALKGNVWSTHFDDLHIDKNTSLTIPAASATEPDVSNTSVTGCGRSYTNGLVMVTSPSADDVTTADRRINITNVSAPPTDCSNVTVEPSKKKAGLKRRKKRRGVIERKDTTQTTDTATSANEGVSNKGAVSTMPTNYINRAANITPRVYDNMLHSSRTRLAPSRPYDYDNEYQGGVVPVRSMYIDHRITSDEVAGVHHQQGQPQHHHFASGYNPGYPAPGYDPNRSQQRHRSISHSSQSSRRDHPPRIH